MIKQTAFGECRELETCILPDGCEIEQALFCFCDNLKWVVLPQSITYIDLYCFGYCSSLQSIFYKGTEQQWENVEVVENARRKSIFLQRGKARAKRRQLLAFRQRRQPRRLVNKTYGSLSVALSNQPHFFLIPGKNKAVCTDGFFPLPNPTARLRLSVGRQTNNAKNRRQKLFKNFCRVKAKARKNRAFAFQTEADKFCLEKSSCIFCQSIRRAAKSVLDELPLPTNRLLKNHQDMPLTTPPYSPVFSI